MIHKTWDSLANAIQRQVGIATMEAQKASLIRLSEYLDRFYDTRDPKLYVRTGHLGSSASAEPFVWTNDGGEGVIYMAEDIPYETGTHSTREVFSDAEAHLGGIIGNPLFWGDTMSDIENYIIPDTFGKYFKR